MSCRGGFTLFEVIVVIGLFSGIMLLVTLFALDIAQFSVYYQEDLAARSELQRGIGGMQSELRSARNSAAGAYPLESAETSSIVFFADTNADGVTERVRYTLRSSTLEKGVIFASGTPGMPAQYPTSTESVRELIYHLTSGGFEYYSSTYTGTQASMTMPADLPTIQVVRFFAVVDLSTSTPSSTKQQATFSVDLRNILY